MSYFNIAAIEDKKIQCQSILKGLYKNLHVLIAMYEQLVIKLIKRDSIQQPRRPMKDCRLVFIYDFYVKDHVKDHVKDTGHFCQEIQKDVTVTRAPKSLSSIQSHMKMYINYSI